MSKMTKTDAQRLAERYHSVRSYLACQQAILLTLLNSNYEIVISKPTKKALISSQVVKVIAISSGSERIDVVDIVEKHCKEIMEKDISNGISQSSAYRRFITNKSIENHHLLIDLLEGIGYFFNSSFSSGKHKSNRLQTINEIFYGKQLIITKDTIQTKGKSISNYMTKLLTSMM
ncbi:TATA-binding protein-associated phosphoprotein [Entamoeba marina]